MHDACFWSCDADPNYALRVVFTNGIWIKSFGEASVTHTKTEDPLGPEVLVCVTEAEPKDLIHFIAHVSKHDYTILF